MTRSARLWAAAAAGALLASVAAVPAQADEIRDAQWMIDALHLPEAWKTTQGEGVTVGLVDTGVDDSHPDLTGQVIGGYDTWQDGGDGTTDDNGHGTAMASLIAGHGHGDGNADGVIGVAPKAKILSVGAMPPGEQEFESREALNDGIRWLADNGADVILLAYGGDTSSDEEKAAVEYATIEKNIPVISGSGNTKEVAKYGLGEDVNRTADYPGAYDSVLTTSGVDQDGEPSEIAVQDPKVMITAPLDGVCGAIPTTAYDCENNGTSDSSAITAGAMALLRAAHPDLTRAQLAWQITETADAKGDKVPNEDYGYGIVDPAKAVGPIADGLPEDDINPTPDPLTDDGEPGADSNAPNQSDTLTPTEGVPLPWLIAGGGSIVLIALITLVTVRARRSTRTRHSLLPRTSPIKHAKDLTVNDRNQAW